MYYCLLFGFLLVELIFVVENEGCIGAWRHGQLLHQKCCAMGFGGHYWLTIVFIEFHVYGSKHVVQFEKILIPKCLFLLQILKKYRDFLENENLPYYWNKYFNLVKYVDSATVNTIYKKINQIINDIERNVNNDPMVVAKYLSKFLMTLLMNL